MPGAHRRPRTQSALDRRDLCLRKPLLPGPFQFRDQANALFEKHSVELRIISARTDIPPEASAGDVESQAPCRTRRIFLFTKPLGDPLSSERALVRLFLKRPPAFDGEPHAQEPTLDLHRPLRCPLGLSLLVGHLCSSRACSEPGRHTHVHKPGPAW